MNSVFESVTRYREVSVSNEMCKTFIVADVMIKVFFIISWLHRLFFDGVYDVCRTCHILSMTENICGTQRKGGMILWDVWAIYSGLS